MTELQKKDFLKGAYDLHFHTAPDVSPRKCTDLELAREWLRTGMKGGVIKSHYADTTGRAALIRELYPELSVWGGLVLNRQAGGLNPAAVEKMAQAGGKFLWFPTLDSREYQAYRHKNEKDFDLSPFIAVCDEDGALKPAVYDVLDVAAKYNLVLGTGHLGEKEGLPLVRAAFERGVKHVVLTHAENPSTMFSEEAQEECVNMGAMVEHSYLMTFWNRVPISDVISQICRVGVENCILVTDFGQPDSPGSAEGIAAYAGLLLENGMKAEEIEYMLKTSLERLFT
ncbi:MAG: amidohydrolase [Lachnoclostridium sp.]|nr:amidohydrolase [Lachnoclostridium sp.]